MKQILIFTTVGLACLDGGCGCRTQSANSVPPPSPDRVWQEISPEEKRVKITFRPFYTEIPVTIPHRADKPVPYRLQPAYLTVVCPVNIEGQKFLLLEGDTGSGVSNPLIALFQVNGPSARLRFVTWNPVVSEIGFEKVSIKGTQLRFVQRKYNVYSKTSITMLPLPKALVEHDAASQPD